jgi:hypothetical protein
MPLAQVSVNRSSSSSSSSSNEAKAGEAADISILLPCYNRNLLQHCKVQKATLDDSSCYCLNCHTARRQYLPAVLLLNTHS